MEVVAESMGASIARKISSPVRSRRNGGAALSFIARECSRRNPAGKPAGAEKNPCSIQTQSMSEPRANLMLNRLLAFCFCVFFVHSIHAADDYKPGPDSQPQPGVPKGELLKGTFDQSKIFPGTVRDYTVYVPKQYDPAKPACVYVNQDGVQYQAPVVFDNLIHRKEIPVLIGIFVSHGKVKAANPNDALDRFNRSYEYDGLGDNYARFLLDEFLPFVAKTHKLNLSTSANDRSIAGSSSGGIAAWTAAWERPDAFSRVFTSVGTYVGLRGGNVYPTLIRKFEPKPIRIFLQDGSNDNNIYGGDWWMAHQGQG